MTALNRPLNYSSTSDDSPIKQVKKKMNTETGIFSTVVGLNLSAEPPRESAINYDQKTDRELLLLLIKDVHGIKQDQDSLRNSFEQSLANIKSEISTEYTHKLNRG